MLVILALDGVAVLVIDDDRVHLNGAECGRGEDGMHSGFHLISVGFGDGGQKSDIISVGLNFLNNVHNRSPYSAEKSR